MYQFEASNLFDVFQSTTVLLTDGHIVSFVSFSRSVLNPFDTTLLISDGFLGLTRCLSDKMFQACHLSCPRPEISHFSKVTWLFLKNDV